MDSDSDSEKESCYVPQRLSRIVPTSATGMPVLELKTDVLDHYTQWEAQKRKNITVLLIAAAAAYIPCDSLQAKMDVLSLQTVETVKKTQQQIFDRNAQRMTFIKRSAEEWVTHDKLLKLVSKEVITEEDYIKEKEARLKRLENAIHNEKERMEKENKDVKEKEAAALKIKTEKKEAAALLLKAQEEKKKAEIAKKNSQHKSVYSAEGLAEYQSYYETIKVYKEKYKPALLDPNFRKDVFKVKKTITRYVSQLQFKQQVILDKANKVLEIINTTKNQSEKAYHVLLNHLAKSILAQAEQEIDATPMAAYFLGRFSALMTGSVPELFPYLIGRLYKRAPILIPHYHDGNPNLSSSELRLLMRYKYEDKHEKTKFESYLKYETRQNSYVMLFAGWLQVMPGPGQPPNRLDVKHGWIWLARICNMPPRTITPTIIRSFLEVAGQRLMREYPRQMLKILTYLKDKMLPLVRADTTNINEAGRKRLENYLRDCFNAGTIIAIPEFIEKKI
ncbi:GLE1-like protein-domain-containing protein [Spinellus fusiger]|nr:GLE1-like protein-domain-containing protein [Spinellus fusiger]